MKYEIFFSSFFSIEVSTILKLDQQTLRLLLINLIISREDWKSVSDRGGELMTSSVDDELWFRRHVEDNYFIDPAVMLLWSQNIKL